MLVDLVQLRTFVGVAEEQHLTRAADRLHISLSAASAHVRAIEDNLGTQLFVRTNRNLQLTAAGRLLLERARELLHQANAFSSFARELHGQMEGQLIIGSSSDVVTSRISDIVVELHRSHPLLGIEMRARASASSRRELKTGELDLGIMLGPIPDADLIQYPVTTVAFCIVGPADWSDRIAAADWAALAAMPWITPTDSSSAYGAILADLFDSRGLHPRSVVRFDNATHARSLMLAGMGLMVMREEHALPDERAGRLAISPLGIAPVPLLITHLASRRKDPLIQGFLASARQIWPDLHPST